MVGELLGEQESPSKLCVCMCVHMRTNNRTPGSLYQQLEWGSGLRHVCPGDSNCGDWGPGDSYWADWGSESSCWVHPPCAYKYVLSLEDLHSAQP